MTVRAWVNVASSGRELLPSDIQRLAASGEVEVFSTSSGKVIGKTLRYEVRDVEDLWAEVEVDDLSFERAAAVVSRTEQGVVLHAVMVTNLPREAIRSLGRTGQA